MSNTPPTIAPAAVVWNLYFESSYFISFTLLKLISCGVNVWNLEYVRIEVPENKENDSTEGKVPLMVLIVLLCFAIIFTLGLFLYCRKKKKKRGKKIFSKTAKVGCFLEIFFISLFLYEYWTRVFKISQVFFLHFWFTKGLLWPWCLLLRLLRRPTS